MEDYVWKTRDCHFNNQQTMQDFIENHVPENFEVFFIDGTYAEMKNKLNGSIWGIHASGNGDSYNHKVRFEFMR
jgi:hypothetical protein